MPPKTPAPLLPALLNNIPKNVQYLLVAGLLFALIGLLKTFSFLLNLTADGIAYLAGANREKEWMPIVLAAMLFGLGARQGILRLQALQPALIPQNQDAIRLPLPAQQQPKPQEIPFKFDSKFEEEIRRAGKKEHFFGLPHKKLGSPTPSKPMNNSNSDSPLQAAFTRSSTPEPQQFGSANPASSLRKTPSEILDEELQQLKI